MAILSRSAPSLGPPLFAAVPSLGLNDLSQRPQNSFVTVVFETFESRVFRGGLDFYVCRRCHTQSPVEPFFFVSRPVHSNERRRSAALVSPCL